MIETGYSAGTEVAQPHIIRIPFTVSDITRSDMITRFIEFWCQTNCTNAWHIREHAHHVEVGFENIQELVHFKLSPEFDMR